MKILQSYDLPIDIDNFPLNIAIFRYEKGEFVVVGFNQTAEKLEELTKKAVIGRKLLDIFPEEKASGLPELLLKVWRTHENELLDLGLHEGQAGSQWRRKALVYLPNGDVMVICRDVSLEICATEAKAHRLMNLIDKSQTVIFYLQNKSKWPVEFVSPNVEQWGYHKADFESGKLTFINLIHPEDYAGFETRLFNCIELPAEQCSQVYRVLTAEGQERWVEDRTVVERNENGDVCRYLCSIVDITEQKKSQSESQLLGEVVDNSANEIYIFKKSDLKFTYVNQGALRKIGYSLEEAREMTPLDIKPEFNLLAFRALLNSFENSNLEELVFDTTHQCKDGSIYDVEVKLHLLTWGAEETYVVFASDITERKKIERQLADSEQKFKLITETTQAGIFIYGEFIEYANPAFLEMTGYRLESLLKMRPWDFVADDLKDTVKSSTLKRLQGEVFPEEYRDLKVVTQSGELKTMRIMTQTISYHGRYAGIGSMVDITDIQEVQAQLTLLSQVVEQTEDLIRVTDKEGFITYANSAFYQFTGFTADEVLGSKPSILKSGQLDRDFYECMWSTILSGESFKGTFINQKKNKEIFHEQQTITPIFNKDQVLQYFVSTGKDITERVLAEQENELLARTDKLTGVANRHKGDEFLEESMLQAQRYHLPLSVILFDIDFFKAVNDENGHQVGDEVLVSLSELVKQEVRKTDLFVRWGGEEFLLITPQTNLAHAEALAEKIRLSVQTARFGEVKQLSISCGVTDMKDKETMEELMVRVDEALYEAKNTGRNKVVIR
jgi:diguanylate cyclase (GGDEF)-like protein/PAS domain S-box-containing protein